MAVELWKFIVRHRAERADSSSDDE
jgi:hypothetical protein